MPRDHILRRGAVAALVAVALGTAPGLAPAARAATVDVSPATIGAPLPNGFLGLSTETYSLPRYTGEDPKAPNPAFLKLLQGIGPGGSPVLRIGGDSTDWSWYPVKGQRRPPGVKFTMTPRWMRIVRATAQASHGRLILGVNLEADNKADAVGEANAMVNQVGRKYIEAMEIGNEPELYTHFAWYRTASGAPVTGRQTATWTQDAYHAQFNAYAHAMPKVPIAGPVNGEGVWLDGLGGFLRAEPFTSLTTIHAYPLKHCTPSHIIRIPEVLADSSSEGFIKRVAPFVAVSHRAGKPIRIDEVNAISCGGTKGVSNSFASALWMVNTLFGLARTGVDGINVHTVPGTTNAILDPVGRGNHPAIAVQPVFYAMLMFARAAPPGSRLLKLGGDLPHGLQAWATIGSQGTIRVVLINKRSSGPEPVRLHVTGASGPATVERLRAPNLAATGKVTLGGETFGSATHTGTLGGTPATETVSPFGGGYDVDLPAASAAMVTLTPQPATLLLSSLSAALQTTW